MRYDSTPLLRQTAGLDRLFEVFAEVQRAGENNYPPSYVGGSTRLASGSLAGAMNAAGLTPRTIAINAPEPPHHRIEASAA
jgi:molecular chaperone IbpA